MLDRCLLLYVNYRQNKIPDVVIFTIIQAAHYNNSDLSNYFSVQFNRL
jgi:hypothetical protein